MKIPKEKIITKFCLFVHTHNFALHGYFTGFLSTLIIKNVFYEDGEFYSFVCSVLAPITFVVVLIILPFWFFYILIDGVVG